MTKRNRLRSRSARVAPADSIVLRGRESLITLTSSGSGTYPIATSPINISAFGDRVSTVAGAFLRWRVKSLRFSYRPLIGTNSSTGGGILGLWTMGVADDTDGTSTSITTRDQILNFRRSVEDVIWKTKQLTWSPLDPNKWYYVTAESSNSDARWITPGTLAFMATAAGLADSINFGFIDVQYVIEFSGASSVAV